MSKNKERSIALQLRKRGLSYNEILSRLREYGYNCAKSSLSNWLKDIKLTKEQQDRVTALEEAGKEKGRNKILETRRTGVS